MRGGNSAKRGPLRFLRSHLRNPQWEDQHREGLLAQALLLRGVCPGSFRLTADPLLGDIHHQPQGGQGAHHGDGAHPGRKGRLPLIAEEGALQEGAKEEVSDTESTVEAAAETVRAAATVGAAEALPAEGLEATTGIGTTGVAGAAAEAEEAGNQRRRRHPLWRRGYRRWKQRCA